MIFGLDPSMLALLVGFGFCAAFIDSVVGGGGLIALPALLFTGLSPSAAVATNKLAGTMGSFTSTFVFYRSGKLDLSSIYKMFPLTFFGSMLGAYTVHLMDPDVLKPLMLIMLAAVGIYTVTKKDWGKIMAYKKLSVRRLILFTALIFLIGFYDGFLGPGTGSFLMFAYLMIGFDFLKAAGNAKFLNFGSNISALLMFIFFRAGSLCLRDSDGPWANRRLHHRLAVRDQKGERLCARAVYRRHIFAACQKYI